MRWLPPCMSLALGELDPCEFPQDAQPLHLPFILSARWAFLIPLPHSASVPVKLLFTLQNPAQTGSVL